MESQLPKRKPTRLAHFDYSAAGAYFVTVCTKDRKPILSHAINPVGDGAHDVPQMPMRQSTYNPVGDGAHDVPQMPMHQSTHNPVGDGALDVPQIHLTPIGRIIEKHLLSSQNISGVSVDQYVIMPDHIHVIFFLDPNAYAKHPNGTSRAPSPTNEMLPHVISTFKRFCNKEIGENIFQRSYAEHIIRDSEDYEIRRKYILENPARWYYREGD